MKLHQLTLATATALALGIGGAMAANAPGVTDTEITIGNTNPYSGPASSYSVIGKAIGACWNWVNDNGASTVARSNGSPMTTVIRRRKPKNNFGN